MAYDSKAHEFVFSFYLKGGGWDRWMPKINLIYPGIAKSTCEQWEKRFNWPARRAELDHKRSEFEDTVRDYRRVMIVDLEIARTKLLEQIQEGQISNQTYYQFTTVCRSIAQLCSEHERQRDPDQIAMQVLTEAFEMLVQRFAAIPALAKVMESASDEIGKSIAEVAERYGRAA
jgi:hypothetical protein